MMKSAKFAEAVRTYLDLSMSLSMRGWRHFARNSGLSMPQFGIMMHLYHSGSCNVSDISQHFETTNAASSQLIDKLVQAGYLERTEDPGDRRTRLLSLTPAGLQLIENGMVERYRWVDELSGHLAPEEQQSICDALELMSRAVRQVNPAG
jgi:DNA-binding MarR family transcriptional regulator